jgi:hypothetical protein
MKVLYYENTKVRKEEVPTTLLLKYKIVGSLGSELVPIKQASM